jgi:hypothetical protein
MVSQVQYCRTQGGNSSLTAFPLTLPDSLIALVPERGVEPPTHALRKLKL